MDPKSAKLIPWLLGELPHEEALAIREELSADANLRAERARLERTLQAVHAVPAVDVADSAVARLMQAAQALDLSTEHEAPVHQLGFWRRDVLMRAAAVVVVAFVLGLGVWITPGNVPESVATVIDDQGRRTVLDGESIESRAGKLRRVVYPTGEVLLDGASSVRVNRTGRNTPPSFEIERGRVVVTASSHPVDVSVAGRHVALESGAVLAVSYDRAYANIAPGGSVVEVQRMPIGDVAAMAEQAYGIKLDAALVPEGVRNRRVTFHGSNLSADAFVDSLLDASSAYGITVDSSRRYLGYTPRIGRSAPNEEWQLDVTLLEGRASFHAEGERVDLASDGEFSNAVTVSASSPDAVRPQNLDDEGLSRAVVWAAGADGALAHRLRGVERSRESLPGANVIHADKLVLLSDDGSRIFKLDGPEFDFPLPGGRQGRLVQLTSSGAVFEVQGQIVREFVPFGR